MLKFLRKNRLLQPFILFLVALYNYTPGSYAIEPWEIQEESRQSFIIAAHEWAPFASRSSKYFGLSPRITSEILHTTGIDVKYRFMHWSDALDGVLTEEFDGAIVWVMQDLKHEAFAISDPIVHLRSALYHRANFPAPKSPSDVLGYRMGINTHYVYDAPSYHMLTSGKLTAVDGQTDLQNFQMLLNGDVDFFLTPTLTSGPLLRNNFSREQQQQLSYTSSVLKFPSIYLVVNRHREGSKDFIEQFNASLKRMKNNGTIDRYIDDFSFSKY